jgi:Leucine-rich repeat (LRR) protein
VSSNQLEGPLPDILFEKMPALQSIDLGSNKLEGELPPITVVVEELVVCKSSTSSSSSNENDDGKKKKLGPALKILLLPLNHLSGGIPSSYARLTMLRELDLSSNDLSGPLPPFLLDGSLAHLEVLDLSRNRLTGSMPSISSSSIDLSSSSSSSSSSNSVAESRASNQGEDGTETAVGQCGIGSLRRLWKLQLQQNALTGPIPLEIGECKRLEFLNLSSNALEGYLPSSLGNLTNLQVLLLNDNPGLLCPLPEGLSNLTKLLDMAMVDPVPSNDLGGARRFNREHFEVTRIQGPSAGLNNWHAPG